MAAPLALTPATDQEHPKVLIPDLLKLFYSLGWVTGTGGGLSVKHEYVPPLPLAPNQSQTARSGVI